MKMLEDREQSRLYQVNVRFNGEELTSLKEAADRLAVPASRLLREGWSLRADQLEQELSR